MGSEVFAAEQRGWPTERILERLFELGHFHNPETPSEVQATDLANMRLTDPEAVAALKSAQEFMAADLSGFTFERHGRPAHADGVLGPATVDLLAMPRCGCPDYPIPGDARSAILEANWPGACRGNLRFGRVFNELPGLSKADTDKVWWAVCNNWSQALTDVNMESAVVGERAVQILAGLKALSGSTLAWSYLARNSCNVILEQAYNTKVRWSLAMACATASHEVGHALGFEHDPNRESLMFYSVHQAGIARYGYPNAADMKQAQRLGYKPSGLPQLPLDRLFGPPQKDPPTEPPTDPGGPTDPDAPGLRVVGSVPGGEIYFRPTVRV